MAIQDHNQDLSRLVPFGSATDIEVVELTDIDLDMAVEMAMQPVLTTADAQHEAVDLKDLASQRFLRDVVLEECQDLFAICQVITMGPGYILLPAGQLNTRLYFVLEGQLRLHPDSPDNRPIGIVDVGLSAGLDSALEGKPSPVCIVAAEHTRVLAIEMDTIQALTTQSHAAARNYAELLTIYLKGQSYIPIGGQGARSPQSNTGFIDELTGLHNGRWLEKMLPRYVSRCTLGGMPLSILMFKIDKLAAISEQRGQDLAQQCLSTLGHAVYEHARVTDLGVRDNDNRFIILLLDSDLAAARELARRIKEMVGKTIIPIGGMHNLPPLKLSMGIAQYDGPLTDLEFLEKVEKILQQAKSVGGNWIAE